MKIRLKNVTSFGSGHYDQQPFEADLYIDGMQVGKAASLSGGAPYCYKINNNEQAINLVQAAENYFEQQAIIQSLSSAIYDAWLRHHLVRTDFYRKEFAPLWYDYDKYLVMFEGSRQRYHVWRLNVRISKLQSDPSGKDLLRQLVVRLLMRDVHPGDYLVDNYLPCWLHREATLYLLNLLSNPFQQPMPQKSFPQKKRLPSSRTQKPKR